MKQIKYYISSSLVFCPSEQKDRVLSELLKQNTAFYDVKSVEEGITFRISAFDLDTVNKIGCCRVLKKKGALPYISAHSDRMGLAVGAVLCIVCLYIASLFIWDVRIEPIEGMEEKEVERILENVGLTPGVYIPSIDMEKIQLNVLMSTDKLSYITVNIDGSVAVVQGQRRKENAEVQDADRSPCDIIAAEDGQIVRYRTDQGMPCRRAGDVVRKGELLISGMYDDEKLDVRILRASGEVYAEVSRHIEVYYPNTVYEKTVTENISEGIAVSVFGKTFGIKGCREYELYDDEEQKENLTVFGVRLPVIICKTKRTEYTYEKRVFDEAETYRRAMDEFEQKLADATADGELTDRKTQTLTDEDGCRIICNITLIKDIAAKSPIQVKN